MVQDLGCWTKSDTSLMGKPTAADLKCSNYGAGPWLMDIKWPFFDGRPTVKDKKWPSYGAGHIVVDIK